jgi:hypothetical protein
LWAAVVGLPVLRVLAVRGLLVAVMSFPAARQQGSRPLAQEYWDEPVRPRPELLALSPYVLGRHPDANLVAVFLDANRLTQIVGRFDPGGAAVPFW